MPEQQSVRGERERLVREHMEAENALEMDRAVETFAHPRYEIIVTGDVYHGQNGALLPGVARGAEFVWQFRGA